jgi:murein tripeptide amidase MpaA
VFISSQFDAGNIRVISCVDALDIQLEIKQDKNSEFYQWFYFRLTGAKNKPCCIKIMNAAGAAYPDGFRNYRVTYSYDRQEWKRHPTEMNSGVLSFNFTPESDTVYFAYFAPFPMERHHQLIASTTNSPLCSYSRLGATLDGQDLDLLKFSLADQSESKPNCWFIARQHPGESMAEWWMEGCIEYLLDSNNESAQKLLSSCNVYLIANMNPDGSNRGHLRTNAAGRNLNREWVAPTLEFSPEVFLVKNAMAEEGVDFLMDVHGDESLPYCFIAGTEGLPEWSKKHQQQLDFYKQNLEDLNSDFQTQRGYPPKPAGQANMAMSTAQTAHRHNCLAMTLEMPFKDTSATPDTVYGWSPARSKLLAHSCLETLQLYLDSDLF